MRQGKIIAGGIAAPNWEKSVRSFVSPSLSSALPPPSSGIVGIPWSAGTSDAGSAPGAAGLTMGASAAGPVGGSRVMGGGVILQGERRSPIRDAAHQHDKVDHTAAGRARVREASNVPADAEVVEVSARPGSSMMEPIVGSR